MYHSLVHIWTCSSPFSWQTFLPSMKNHSAYNIQIPYVCARETRYFNVRSITFKLFLSRTIALASHFRRFFSYVSKRRLLNFEIALSAYFEFHYRPPKRLYWGSHELNEVERTIARISFSRLSKVKGQTGLVVTQLFLYLHVKHRSAHVNKYYVSCMNNNMCDTTLLLLDLFHIWKCSIALNPFYLTILTALSLHCNLSWGQFAYLWIVWSN